MAPPAKRLKRSTGQYTSARILTASSPVVTANIQGFLALCISGWDENYTEQEKHHIIQSLPLTWQTFEHDHNGKLICPVSFEFVHEDPHIRQGVTNFRSNVADGYYSNGWQNHAHRARHDKLTGKFDEYVEKKVQDLFGDTGETSCKPDPSLELSRCSTRDQALLQPAPSNTGSLDGSEQAFSAGRDP